jgi:hypothetical protein
MRSIRVILLAALTVASCASPSTPDVQATAICLRDALVGSGLADRASIESGKTFLSVVFDYRHADGKRSVEKLSIFNIDESGNVDFGDSLQNPDWTKVGNILESKCSKVFQGVIVT